MIHITSGCLDNSIFILSLFQYFQYCKMLKIIKIKKRHCGSKLLTGSGFFFVNICCWSFVNKSKSVLCFVSFAVMFFWITFPTCGCFMNVSSGWQQLKGHGSPILAHFLLQCKVAKTVGSSCNSSEKPVTVSYQGGHLNFKSAPTYPPTNPSSCICILWNTATPMQMYCK